MRDRYRVEDDGSLFGLARDLALVNNSKDKFANLLASLITEKIGAEYSPYIKIRFEALDHQEVCVVDVSQSASPAYYSGEKGAEFYTRLGPTSRMLDAEEAVSYINNKWNS